MNKLLKNRKTANSSIEEEQSRSPIIVPRSIRTVSCNIIDLEGSSSSSSCSEEQEEPLKRTPSVHDEDYISNAINFLMSIESKECPSSPSQDSRAEYLETSYEQCLEQSNPPPIDLRDWPGTIELGAMKENLNAEFAELHPFLDKHLTLSKILNLREKIFKVYSEEHFDKECVVAAWVYFLVLLTSNCVNKRNRKVFAAVCLVLSLKFNEEFNSDLNEKLQWLFRKLKTLDENFASKEVLRKEFEVYAMLNFSLSVSPEDYHVVLQEFLSRFRNVVHSP